MDMPVRGGVEMHNLRSRFQSEPGALSHPPPYSQAVGGASNLGSQPSVGNSQFHTQADVQRERLGAPIPLPPGDLNGSGPTSPVSRGPNLSSVAEEDESRPLLNI
jgi:hypothetical protein